MEDMKKAIKEVNESMARMSKHSLNLCKLWAD
jgi:hypothetical protein